MRLTLVIFINCLWVIPASGQQLIGCIKDQSGEALPGATLRWAAGSGTITDEKGHYQLEVPQLPDTLSITYVGFERIDTFLTTIPQDHLDFYLSDGSQLQTIEIEGRQRGNFTSTLETRNVESITTTELRAAACCNLGESFETNPSVDVSYADPLTGSREIQLLGL